MRIKLDRVKAAVERLVARDVPKPGAGLPGFFALKREGLRVGTWTDISPSKFADLAQDYFLVSDPPRPTHPYFNPLAMRDGWTFANWPRGGLFTRMKEGSKLSRDGKLKFEGTGSNYRWKLEDGYEASLDAYVPQGKIPLADWLAWMYRDKVFADGTDPSELEGIFRNEFNLTDAEMSHLFTVDWSAETPETFFSDEDWPSDAVKQVLPEPGAGETTEGGSDEGGEGEGAPPPDPIADDDLVRELMARLKDKFDVDEELVRNVLTGMRSDRFVVLVGQPGTGKTEFVRAFTRALGDVYAGRGVKVHGIDVVVGEDFAEYQVIGYRDLAGRYVPSDLVLRLNSGDPTRDIYVVLLDEMNIASIDLYGSKLLGSVKSGFAIDLPGEPPDDFGSKSRHWYPPPATFLIGTMNSYLEDPTRRILSVPVKRRATLVTMPNPLRSIVGRAAADDDAAKAEFAALCGLLLRQAYDRWVGRRESVIDADSLQRLLEPVDPTVVDALWALSKMLAPNEEVAFTLGVVQSVLVSIATAHSASVAEALDIQLAQRLVPILRGDADVITKVQAVVPAATFPRTQTELGRLRALAQGNQDTIRPMF